MKYRSVAGTVEGRLRAIADRSGRLQFALRDELTGRSVNCRMGEYHLFRAMTSFRQRVQVQGRVRLRPDGSPVSVDVRHIKPFPDDSRLPAPAEVRGLLSQQVPVRRKGR